MISCKLVGCRVRALWSLHNISITILNIKLLLWVGKPDRVAGLFIPALSERAFKILVLDRWWIPCIMRQWPLISEEEVSTNAELSPGKKLVPQKWVLGQEPGIPIESLCPTSQSLHASSNYYFHSKKPQLLFILLFPTLLHITFQGRETAFPTWIRWLLLGLDGELLKSSSWAFTEN